MIDWTKTMFWTGYLFLAVVLIIAGIALGAARATVQVDAYRDLPSDLPIVGTWIDCERGLMRAETPCDPAEDYASDGVIILGEENGAHYFVVPEGVRRFRVNCEVAG